MLYISSLVLLHSYFFAHEEFANNCTSVFSSSVCLYFVTMGSKSLELVEVLGFVNISRFSSVVTCSIRSTVRLRAVPNGSCDLPRYRGKQDSEGRLVVLLIN